MRILFTLFLLLSYPLLFAQEVMQIRGRVLDSLNKPIELSNVIAVDTASGKIKSYAVTDEEGRFKLNLEINEIYSIKASYVGFENYERIIQADSKISELIIPLKSKDKTLDDVEIVYEFPIRLSGDTVIYNADSFNKGDERKLEDVLKNLPGFEIDEYGQIKVQGKSVDKVLVEGKPFFDGDSKMATENIPANAVDKVELLRNFTEVGPMQGLDNSDRMALNIKLADDKKDLLFGDLEGAIGTPEKTLAHSNMFYYNPKTNINLILNTNNIGKQAFGPREYYRFGAGMEELNSKTGQGNVQLSRDNAFGNLPNNTAKAMNNSVEALNFYYSPKKLSVSGLAIASQSRNNLFTENQRTYLKISGDNQEELLSDESQNNFTLLSKIGLKYEPNANLYLSYDIMGKASELNETLNQESSFLNNTNFIESTNAEKPYSISQKFNGFVSVGKKDLVSFQVESKNEFQNPKLSLKSNSGLFGNQFGDSSLTTTNIDQTLKLKQDNVNLQGNYFRILSRKSHFNVTAGYAYNEQSLKSEIIVIGQLDSSNSNNASLIFSNPYIGMNIKQKIGKFIFNPGLNLQYIEVGDYQSFDRKHTQLNLLPSFYSKYEISSSQDIVFRYSVENNFYSISNLAENLIIGSYNTINIGNRNLENAVYHNLNLNYFNFNLFSSFNISGGANYQYRIRNIGDSLQLNGIQRINSKANMDGANDNLMTFSHFEKTFNKFRIGAKVELSNTRFTNYLDSDRNNNQSFRQLYNLNFETTLFKKLTFTLAYDKSFNQYQGLAINNQFTQDSPSFKALLKIHKNLKLRSSYEYNYYRNTNGNSKTEYQFLSSELSYQKVKNPWTISVRANNITNTKSVRSDAFSDNLVNISSYYVLPRFLLLSVKYDL